MIKNPEDYVFYRKNISLEDMKERDIVVYKYKYRELREIIAASVRSVDGSVRRLLKGETVKTKYGIYWAEPKSQNI